MKEEYSYLNDEELEALIAGVEKNGMIAPPVYLKELIMERAAQEQDTFEEGLPKEWIPKTAENKQKAECGLSTESSIRAIEVRKEEARRAKRRFRIYSFKIAAAAAVAVFCLTCLLFTFVACGGLSSGVCSVFVRLCYYLITVYGVCCSVYMVERLGVDNVQW